MKCKPLSILLLMFLVCGHAQAQEKKSLKEKILHFLDSSNVIGTDPEYIGLPEKKWSVSLNYNTDQQKMTMEDQHYYNRRDAANGGYLFQMKIKPPVSNSIGFYAAYRGWGAGYSLSLSGNKGFNMSFNIATPSSGVNIRVHRYDFSDMESGLYNHVGGDGERFPDIIYMPTEDYPCLEEPMKIESFSFDGYWIFNQKRFALPAAYGQSVIQKRSAGSLIAGLMFYYHKYDISQVKNSFQVEYMDRMGKLKIYQGSLGFGYTYNWVPVRGLLLNAVAMPVLTLVNRVNVYKYKPQFLVDDPPEDDERWNYIVMKHFDTVKNNGKIRLNMAARCSVTYWFHNWFATVMAQGQQFSTKYDNTKIKSTDWEVKTAIGITF